MDRIDLDQKNIVLFFSEKGAQRRPWGGGFWRTDSTAQKGPVLRGLGLIRQKCGF
jgi:hypothetical protein